MKERFCFGHWQKYSEIMAELGLGSDSVTSRRRNLYTFRVRNVGLMSEGLIKFVPGCLSCFTLFLSLNDMCNFVFENSLLLVEKTGG